ncbi:hypothetical protein TVAG_292600 [Trichomonas vaginalis G3]|uniref:Serine aminopeptidase S33 domain-containing protein n=1 Tax=Trichomonas vaginalis (strain ATCC PRA-98 / G3) TaxID=412133 RepID=A2F0D2_TRIV3|nr:palmitoyl-(protein) hydrolase protein [Trichomonas vaginalis G3]EAY01627.1 hypothetical protein TVAG_292600 [Trichomonas vaginalis G3]KAI5551592.1 palmitoyl-(protein) hydrolase protein [Trichomonas vaginalis G3]|eukprot:XP_001330359.1 hypothetical protein [Trichomonas vaginalis G3]
MNMSISEIKEKAIGAIIRPPRREYDISDLPLKIASNNLYFSRHPINFRNQNKEKIVGSLYFMEGIDPMGGIPCVLYLHGNASSQMEGQFLVPNLCPYGIAVYCFDFAGCGNSSGEYISLGYYEQRDVEMILQNLMSSYRFTKFVLWGRSMGAATAILTNHPNLVGRVVDSTFTSIYDVSYAIASSMGVPGLVIGPAIWYLRSCINNLAKFDIYDVVPLEAAKKGMDVPMIMGHATDDEFVPFAQGQAVFEAYNGSKKEFVILTGGHNGRRTNEWISRACRLCLRVFGMNPSQYKYKLFTGFDSSENDPHYKSFMDMINSQKAPNQEETPAQENPQDPEQK